MVSSTLVNFRKILRLDLRTRIIKTWFQNEVKCTVYLQWEFLLKSDPHQFRILHKVWEKPLKWNLRNRNAEIYPQIWWKVPHMYPAEPFPNINLRWFYSFVAPWANGNFWKIIRNGDTIIWDQSWVNLLIFLRREFFFFFFSIWFGHFFCSPNLRNQPLLRCFH